MDEIDKHRLYEKAIAAIPGEDTLPIRQVRNAWCAGYEASLDEVEYRARVLGEKLEEISKKAILIKPIAKEWSLEDHERYISCLQRLGSPEQPENINTKWFKEHCHHIAQWKPTEDQMQELYKMVCECRPADTQLLSDIYWGLKSLL